MIHLEDVVVLSPKITPTEARIAVLASWTSEANTPLSSLQLAGQVTGPLCEYATTLSERVPLQNIGAESGNRVRAAAQVLEPCFWEPQHPFCYEIQLELHGNAGLLDMRRIISGIRHLAVAKNELLLNGQDMFLKGVRHQTEATVEELELWHEVECSALMVSASQDLCARTDRYGPMVLHVLPRTKEEVTVHVVRLRNHPSVLIWVLPPRIGGRDLDEIVGAIKANDPSRPIGQFVAIDEPLFANSSRPVDLFFLPAGHRAIGSANLGKPYAVLADMEADPDVSQFENFTNETEELCRSLGSPPGLVGVIL
jgi:hypothetical protein